MMASVALIACGAPLAKRVLDVAACLKEAGWATTVIGTPSSGEWLDVSGITKLLGSPPRFSFRSPGQNKLGEDPDFFVLLPATFNTLNKVSAGIADNYATAVACEALGSAAPLVVVPMVNESLWGHIAWTETLTRLGQAGVHFLDVRDGSDYPRAVPSGSGDVVVARFEPSWVLAALKGLA